MKRRCKIHRIGLHTAWITIEGAPNSQLIPVPKEAVSSGHGADGPYPGDQITVKFLPGWVEEVAGLTV